MSKQTPSTEEVREIAMAYALKCKAKNRRPKLSDVAVLLGRHQRWLTTASAMRMKLSELGLGSSRRVINLDTGEVYPAAKNAARAVGRKVESVRHSIRVGGTCAGYRWAYVDEMEEQRHA